MADVQLPYPRQPGDRLDVEVVERMTGVEPHAERANGLAGAPDALELGRHRRALLVASLRMEGVSIRSGMHFAHRRAEDRKSTRLNSSHGYISYAVFCLKKKNNN